MSKCLYCGSNPVPHPIHKFYESFDILFRPIRRTISHNWFGHCLDKMTGWMGMKIYQVTKPLGIIKINRDIEQVPYARAKALWQEAINRKIDFEEIKPFNRSIDLYKTKIKGRELFFFNLPRPERVEEGNLTWIDDKYWLKKKLLEHNLPASPGGSFTTFSSVLKAFQVLEKPVIVKPRTGSRGRHTTTFVYNQEQLKEAFQIAKRLCHWVVVEEHLFGDVQRATVIGGRLIGMLGGTPPRVTGDGKQTIAELIKIKNACRPEKVKEIQVNPYYMMRANLTMGTVLSDGQIADLSEKIGVNYGGTSYDCTDLTHPETKQMFETAGRILGLSILGFDFIIPDITKSYKEQKCGIIEANGAPFINLHHDPLYGRPINAAGYVWDLVGK